MPTANRSNVSWWDSATITTSTKRTRPTGDSWVREDASRRNMMRHPTTTFEWIRAIAAATLLTLAASSAALAQSAIAGTVRDASGAVLPGVSVEAASAALIEGARTAVTDNSGA